MVYSKSNWPGVKKGAYAHSLGEFCMELAGSVSGAGLKQIGVDIDASPEEKVDQDRAYRQFWLPQLLKYVIPI